VCNLSFLIDHEGGAIGDSSVGHQDTVSLGSLAGGKIAEEREGEGKLLGKFTLGGNIIGADPEDLRVSAFKLGDTSLVSREFLGSTTGKRCREESHHHVLFAPVVGELDLLALGGGQFEIRRHVAHLEVSFGRWRLGE
jgi:hypothetical protein